MNLFELAYKEIPDYCFLTLSNNDWPAIYHLLEKDNEYEKCSLSLMREKDTKNVKERLNLPTLK